MFSLDTHPKYLDDFQIYDIEKIEAEVSITNEEKSKVSFRTLYNFAFYGAVIFYNFENGDFIKIFKFDDFSNSFYYLDGRANKRMYFFFNVLDYIDYYLNYLFTRLKRIYYFYDEDNYSSINF